MVGAASCAVSLRKDASGEMASRNLFTATLFSALASVSNRLVGKLRVTFAEISGTNITSRLIDTESIDRMLSDALFKGKSSKHAHGIKE